MTVRCPNCATDLPDGMAFCGACGSPLPRRCGACGTVPATQDQRFCGACGAPLDRSAASPRERRLISVLFCDLVGFTTFSEARDHEDVRDVLEHYFTATRHVVASYGGTIEKFIGDAVMAVWGAPIAREDDAERSVRAGIDVAAAVSALAERLSIPELQVRVGILTGEATVDTGSVHEGMVIGDSVNTAARIQSLAQPGTVLVDDLTRVATERSIAYEPAGTHAVKGRSAPVRVWQALRVVSRLGGAGRPDVVEAPLVGRGGELAQIRDAIDGLLGPDPNIQLVTVTGDAGLGKTRLVWEFEKSTDALATRVRWLRGRALGFGEGAGFSALAEAVRMAAGISLHDPPERQRAMLDDLLENLLGADDGGRSRVARSLYRLMELDDGTELIEQGMLFAAWRALFERLAARAPVVLILEELHVADQGLLDFISHLLDWAPRARIMIVALGRPDVRLDQLASEGERIELKPLSEAMIDRLVSGVVRDPPESLLAAVRADGGGIPLYAVETLRALADRGVLAVEDGRYVVFGELGELTMPPTIRALVASRLDRLGRLERRVLAGGAVLGERFAAARAAALIGIEEADTTALLDGLVAKAILSRDTDPRSPLRGRYGFLQGVVRRELLSRLPRRVRKELHLAAVEHLQRGAPEPELPAQLASHLLAAEQADPDGADAGSLRRRAGSTLRQAGERAAAVGALEEALALLDRAAELAEDERDRASLLERGGAVAQRAGTFEVAAERYRRASEAYARSGRDRERLGATANELRALLYVRAPAELLGRIRELDAAAWGPVDAASAHAAAALAYTLYQGGESAEALAAAERAVRTAEACGASAELVLALGAQGSSLAELERPEEAIYVYRRAMALVEGRDERLVATLSGNLAVSFGSLGRYAECATQARHTVAAARRGADRVVERWSRLVLGRSLCSLGEWDEAIAEIEAVIDHVPTYQFGMVVAPLAVIALARGQDERVRALVSEYDRRSSEAGAGVFESDFRVLRTAILAVADADVETLARMIPDAEVADYAEWTGWLAPVVDRLVAVNATEPLEAALSALQGGGRMKRTPPVQAQAERLAAHLAGRAEDERAEGIWVRAEELATGCGLRFEAAVLALERTEHTHGGGPDGLGGALATFEELGAEPWLARARRAHMARTRR